MNRYRSLALLLWAAVCSACDKNAVQDITGPLASARIKFFHFGVNAPGVNFYANDTKMTAITSATGAAVWHPWQAETAARRSRRRSTRNFS